MTVIGFHCSHEQINPAQLLRDVQQAEQVGFTAGMSSDHFSPWSARQGESGLAWSFLGAALASTTLPFCVVNAPGQRYHPAIIGQAIATLAQMFPGRFWAALGSGVASNERVAGDVWARKEVRDQRPGRVRHHHPSPFSRRGGQPRRPRPRQQGTAVDSARNRSRPRRPGRHARDRGPSRRMGGRPDHRQSTAGHAAAFGEHVLPQLSPTAPQTRAAIA